MTALVHMGDEDLKALGVPMVNLQDLVLISFFLLYMFLAIFYLCYLRRYVAHLNSLFTV